MKCRFSIFGREILINISVYKYRNQFLNDPSDPITKMVNDYYSRKELSDIKQPLIFNTIKKMPGEEVQTVKWNKINPVPGEVKTWTKEEAEEILNRTKRGNSGE